MSEVHWMPIPTNKQSVSHYHDDNNASTSINSIMDQDEGMDIDATSSDESAATIVNNVVDDDNDNFIHFDEYGVGDASETNTTEEPVHGPPH
jgi:hypothetical protein